jgi:hypothetical protein
VAPTSHPGRTPPVGRGDEAGDLQADEADERADRGGECRAHLRGDGVDHGLPQPQQGHGEHRDTGPEHHYQRLGTGQREHHPDEPSQDYTALAERALATEDPHAIKYVEACRREDKLKPGPAYAVAATDWARRCETGSL